MSMLESLERVIEALGKYDRKVKIFSTLATLLGASIILIYSISFVREFLKGVKLYVLSQISCKENNWRQKYGQWALVTGSTDGIGLAMAKELANRGHSIIIVARNQEKLDKVVQILKQEPNVGQVLAVKIDLADSSGENYARIWKEIDPDTRNIGVLINNAGSYDTKIGQFHMHDLENIKSIVNVNLMSTLSFTRMLLPGMIKRRRGLIINVSSCLGQLTSSNLSVYSQTKAFINSFSRSLQIEYREDPIDIINLTTGLVSTKIIMDVVNFNKLVNLFVVTPEIYARSALNAANTLIPSFSGCLPHALMLQGGILLEKLGLSSLWRKVIIDGGAKDDKVFDSCEDRKTV